jgi:hypothetical protein
MRSKLVADIQTWLAHHRVRVATKSPLGEALAYIIKYWESLKLFLTDGRIEIDNNSVERTIRPIALNLPASITIQRAVKSKFGSAPSELTVDHD